VGIIGILTELSGAFKEDLTPINKPMCVSRYRPGSLPGHGAKGAGNYQLMSAAPKI